MPEHRLTVPEALARLPGPAGERYVELFQHGTLSVELYAPRGSDPQTSSFRGTGSSGTGTPGTPSAQAICCSCPRAWCTGSRTSPTISPSG